MLGVCSYCTHIWLNAHLVVVAHFSNTTCIWFMFPAKILFTPFLNDCRLCHRIGLCRKDTHMRHKCLPWHYVRQVDTHPATTVPFFKNPLSWPPPPPSFSPSTTHYGTVLRKINLISIQFNSFHKIV